MNRREFCASSLLLLTGCGGAGGEMAEYQLQPSPTRKASLLHSDVPGYSQGTWTPTLGGTATYTVQTGTYTRIGNLVFIQGEITVNLIGTGSQQTISGLPFNVVTTGVAVVDGWVLLATALTTVVGSISGSSITFGGLAAAAQSTASPAIFGDSTSLRFSGFFWI